MKVEVHMPTLLNTDIDVGPILFYKHMGKEMSAGFLNMHGTGEVSAFDLALAVVYEPWAFGGMCPAALLKEIEEAPEGFYELFTFNITN